MSSRLSRKAYLRIMPRDCSRHSRNIPQTIERYVGQGVREIFVMPLKGLPRRHVRDVIPQWIEDAKAKHPEIDFHFCTQKT